ncbi:MAG: gamma-glutamylcyclotransferase [Rhodobacteraceae bacterium]|nr:gamma-glutamylcyclotransferase [Paracoccaceae bacterium]
MGLAAMALMGVYFFYGTLCHPPLLAAVLGRAVAVVPARLPGYRVVEAEGPEGGRAFPLLVEGGDAAVGVLVRGLTEADAARLDYYEAGFAFAIREVAVEVAGGPQPARVYFAEAGRWRQGAPWVLADWVAAWGEIVTEAAADFMAGIGRVEPEAALARYPSVLARAASRIRARGAGVATRRRQAEAGDVAVDARELAHAGFFSLEEYRLRHRRFDGTMSAPIHRTAFVSTDVAVLLPYDPVRDRVLLVEQFRIAPFARGDENPWLLEPIAGRVDAGETPEAAVRREAVEEAGLSVGALIAGPRFYPSPGAKTEHVYSFLALADLPDSAAGFGGLQGEGEDIRVHVLGFAEAEALMDSGEVATGPLWVLLLWLGARRAALRAEAAARQGGEGAKGVEAEPPPA